MTTPSGTQSSTSAAAQAQASIPATKLSAPATPASAPATKSFTPATLVVGRPCEVALLPTSAQILICQQDGSWVDKFIPTIPSLFTSITALFLSWSALKYNRTKDQRARQQSVNDDYWIRKVVSPFAIEPFLKYLISLPVGLPSSKSNPEEVQFFWTSAAASFGEFTSAFGILEQIDKTLHGNVAGLLEGMEDALSDYCGQLQQHLMDAQVPHPDRARTAGLLRQSGYSITQAIASYQANVGNR